MATTTNGNGNLVDEFEEAFQSCLNVLTKEDALPSMEKDEIRVEMDHSVMRFLDLARQMEAFFLQKRFLLSALKPELVVREDINDLRLELMRKDDLIKRHYEKITMWQNLLADLQSQGWAKSPAQGPTGMSNGQPPPPQSQPTPGPGAMSTLQMQQQMQQAQQIQHQQQMHQQMQQQMQQQVGPNPMMSPQQAMFMQRGPFPGQVGPQGGLLQGPLAYLEKTTSNIGLPDGRR
ncbi:mediator of RNA polymerase II transcription subunit 28 [Macrosteles quadrilineatus]|uniref:mediator of RNA polymerase II transcription subunit 28 n=1 Tax=Macrosteles quadrilineatus TaxID=74068 RepID=UPI0023E1B495|nr:mediator of RNA polymerase II transcription subunit 28 [Macrosteles quadrilineatus]